MPAIFQPQIAKEINNTLSARVIVICSDHKLLCRTLKVMGPDPTQPEHIFDLQQIRGQPVFDPGTFYPTRRDFFLDLKLKKLKNMVYILGQIFQPHNPNQTRPTRPDSSNKILT